MPKAVAAALPVMALVLAPSPVSAQGDVQRLVLSPPSTVLQIDASRLEGEPSRLSWSPDGRMLYLRTTAVDLWGNETSRHCLVHLARPMLEPVGAEPPWAASYWLAKSALSAPGVPGFKVDLESREERATATGVQGSLAPATDPSRGAELGPQGAAIASSVIQSQRVVRSTLQVKGERIGEFVNTQPRMGLTFGWGPSGSGFIAYVDEKKRLGVMDQGGRRQVIGGAREAQLPAWSPDGRKLALLEKVAKRRYALRIVEVAEGKHQ